jgi:hypothetical protein
MLQMLKIFILKKMDKSTDKKLSIIQEELVKKLKEQGVENSQRYADIQKLFDDSKSNVNQKMADSKKNISVLEKEIRTLRVAVRKIKESVNK